VFRAFSAVGSPPGLAAIGGIAALAFAVRRRFAAAIAVVATASVEVLVLAMRFMSDRPRPADELASVLAVAPGTSFPSGHAAATAGLGVVIVAVLDVSARVRGLSAVLAGFVAAGAGISRIYLGVHWPTDVIAGWALGLVTGMLIIAQYRRRSS
jgi:undecaprenyl-diphosphatase